MKHYVAEAQRKGAACIAFLGTSTKLGVGQPAHIVFTLELHVHHPMLAMFNSTIEKIAKFCYTYQIKLFFSVMDSGIMNKLGIIVLAGSLVAAVTAFIIAYRRNGLE